MVWTFGRHVALLQVEKAVLIPTSAHSTFCVD